MFGTLPVAVGQVEPAQPETVQSLCAGLVAAARDVDYHLRTVSDRESGMLAAVELKQRLEYMRSAMEKISRVPQDSPDAVRVLERAMRDLLHITQGYMPVVQRLSEVNAYGAEELIALFHYYKLSASRGAVCSLGEESALERAYNEWCDSLDDALYLLRRIQNRAVAENTLPELTPALNKIRQRFDKVNDLQAGLTPQQVDSERLPKERLLRLQNEFRAEIRRLQSVQAFGVKAILPLLEAYALAI